MLSLDELYRYATRAEDKSELLLTEAKAADLRGEKAEADRLYEAAYDQHITAQELWGEYHYTAAENDHFEALGGVIHAA